MEILNPKTLSDRALNALRRGREPKKVIYGYALLVLIINVVVIGSDYLMDYMIASTGGLSNMGNRAILSTIQQAVPSIASYLGMCLELGFLGAMMRLCRGQYADHTDMKVGLRLFWPLLRMTILMSMLFFLVLFLVCQVVSMFYGLTPRGMQMAELLYPYLLSGESLDEATLTAAWSLMVPMLVIVLVVGIAALIPLIFRFRMANYCLLDYPREGARAALRRSNRMMKGKFLPMLKLDLSLWLYHVSMVLVSVILYLDVLLPALGVQLPLDAKLLGLIVYVLSTAWQFFVQLKLRPRAEGAYLMAYEALREKKEEDGVVLGNIFQM